MAAGDRQPLAFAKDATDSMRHARNLARHLLMSPVSRCMLADRHPCRSHILSASHTQLSLSITSHE